MQRNSISASEDIIQSGECVYTRRAEVITPDRIVRRRTGMRRRSGGVGSADMWRGKDQPGIPPTRPRLVISFCACVCTRVCASGKGRSVMLKPEIMGYPFLPWQAAVTFTLKPIKANSPSICWPHCVMAWMVDTWQSYNAA